MGRTDRRCCQGQRHWGEPRRFRRRRNGVGRADRAWGCRDAETKKGRKTEAGEENDRKSKGDRPWEHEPMVRAVAGRARWEAGLSVQLLDAVSPEQSGG